MRYGNCGAFAFGIKKAPRRLAPTREISEQSFSKDRRKQNGTSSNTGDIHIIADFFLIVKQNKKL